jgi:hypothetical protein
MTLLAALFESGHIADLVIGVMAIEAVVLVGVMRRSPFNVAMTLLPGAFMMLALRAALTGADWEVVALWITASLPVHLTDLWLRSK